MDVVGLTVSTCEPARLIMTIAHSAMTRPVPKTATPHQTRSGEAGMNGSGYSQSSPRPTAKASTQAIGGRMTALEVSGRPFIAAACVLESDGCGPLIAANYPARRADIGLHYRRFLV